MNDLRVFLFKITLGVVFFLGLSWANLFLTPQPALAVRKTADDVYVQPVTGLDDTGLFGPTKEEIVEALIMDNYQVYCATPAQEMSAEIGEKYLQFLKWHFGKTKIHQLETTVEADDSIFNPLILDDTGEEQKAVFKEDKQSYVQYLTNSKTNADPIQEHLVTADYYKLLSLKEQCEVQKEAQKRVIYLCSKLKDTPLSECPLNITIPNTSAEIAEVDIPSCDNISDPEVIKNLSESATLISLANLPLPQAYGKRPAYLLTCVNQIPSGASIFGGGGGSLEEFSLYMFTNWKNILSSLFGALRHKLNLKKDECSIRTILVDSDTTEQEKVNSIEAHNYSRNILTPWEDQVIIEEEYESEKGGMRDIVFGEIAEGFNSDDRVNLVGSANTQTKALTHMVNGLAPVCDNKTVRPESAPTITSEANFSEGGRLYKKTSRTAADDFGLLDSLRNLLNSEIETGERTKNDINNRKVILETFLIAPYDAQITLDQFFSPLEEYTITKEQVENERPTHVQFNKGVGEGQEYDVTFSSNKSSEDFWDPDNCVWKPGHTNKNGDWVNGHWDCMQTYTVGIGDDINQELGVDVIAAKTRGNVRAMQSLFPYGEPAYKHVERFGSSTEANNEKLIKGDSGDGDGDEEGEEASCEEVKNMTTELPTMNGLMRMVCSTAGNDKYDAQLLWGLIQIEGWNMLNAIAAGQSSMSCGEIVSNSCGASQITGQLVPQCIDKEKCPQAAYLADDTSDATIADIRENPEIACDIATQLDFTLKKRKSEVSYLTSGFTSANGRSPSKEELYQMMAGRNYGVPEEYLFQPGCGSYEAVSGCGGANYCVCAINTFTMDCGNIR